MNKKTLTAGVLLCSVVTSIFVFANSESNEEKLLRLETEKRILKYDINRESILNSIAICKEENEKNMNIDVPPMDCVNTAVFSSGVTLPTNSQTGVVSSGATLPERNWKTIEFENWCFNNYKKIFGKEYNKQYNANNVIFNECSIYGDGVSSDNLKGIWEEFKNTGSVEYAPFLLKKNYKWRVNNEGKSKSKEELGGTTFTEVLTSHGLGMTTRHWIEMEKKYGVKREVPLCIAWADSGLGKYLKTENNFGNVGNNDRGNKVAFKTKEAGIEAIFRVLNNKYLSHKQSIGSLSPGGGGNSPFYATSPSSWNVNVLNCLSTLYDRPIDENFLFRV